MSAAPRIERAMEVFLRHRECPSCSDDALLVRHQDLADLLASLLGGATPSGQSEPSAPAAADEQQHRIGGYAIRDVLGEGGMGTVYLAEQDAPVRRQVALKVIKLGMDTRRVLVRFDAERQALALMEHDSIAKVFDVGTTERGQPFFVMELVRGTPITQWCDREQVPIRQRLELMRQVCAGVQHAHVKGVIHRDIKPSNILVVVQDGRPMPKIIDFGLARATERTIVEATVYTELGHVVGTPEYMSPEQAGLDGVDVDTRTDVYSLGVVLYELLTGELPFPRALLLRAGLIDLHRAIRESEPARPSTRISGGDLAEDIARRRGTDAHTLQRRLRGDLDWIVLKALEKDRERRYQSAAELAQDLERHLRDEPVGACPPSLGYRMRKLVRRHRVPVAAGAAVALAIVAGTVASALFAVSAGASERAAKLSEQKARDEAAETELQRREAVGNLAKFNLLANVVKLREAKTAEEKLWPPWPERAAAMRAWLEQQRPLTEQMPALRTALAQLAQPELPADRFLHDTLAQLVADLDAFMAPSGLVAGVTERLEWAEKVRRLSIDEHMAQWDAARAALEASARYGGLRLVPQLGLVPLGADPQSGLEEFYDLRSAAPGSAVPARDAHGALPKVAADTGVIFVLIPGGAFRMGAQKEDPAAPNFDPDAVSNEAPTHEVTLGPFFISKYEMTQAQWKRLSGGEQPSAYKAGVKAGGTQKIGWTNPVEYVSWDMCSTLLEHHGLVLPTEAQWEYACRAGTATPWSCGDRAACLEGYANLADATARAQATNWGAYEPFDDGYVVDAPVGSFRPNAFGLFDMHGNVWEWCRDVVGKYEEGATGSEGLHQGGDPRARAMRGGGYDFVAAHARSAARATTLRAVHMPTVGVRPARHILAG